MKINEVFNSINDVWIYQFIYNEDDWLFTEEPEYFALNGQVLREEITLENLLDGNFPLRGLAVSEKGDCLPCWLQTTMPEAVIEDVYIVGEDGNVFTERWAALKKERGVCLAPIEKYVNSEIYYFKPNPDIGINALKLGLEQSEQKWIYATEIAEILRDEKRYSEAIKYFEIANRSSIPDSFRKRNMMEIELIKRLV